jgi:hypothetical protein
MEETFSDISLIEKEFENLVLTSKLYINNRHEEGISILKNNIEVLNKKLNTVIVHSKEKADSSTVTCLNILKKVIYKLETTIQLLEMIKSVKPIYKQMDVPMMVDIVLSGIKSLIYFIGDKEPINVDNLVSDLQTVESLEDQHKRVLMTYLMQDWDNLKEVLVLMKIGEVYKTISGELVNTFLLMHPSEVQ